MKCSCPAGTSSSGKIAFAGHSGSHSVQSMHSSGSITRKFGPSWKQSTGQTSTQSVYLHLMQFSVTTKGMELSRVNYAAQASEWKARSERRERRWIRLHGAQEPECTQHT